MTTPFDKAIEAISRAGYHNHRLETHSDTVSTELFDDLVRVCETLRHDVEGGVVPRRSSSRPSWLGWRSGC